MLRGRSSDAGGVLDAVEGSAKLLVTANEEFHAASTADATERSVSFSNQHARAWNLNKSSAITSTGKLGERVR
jgi:hypothetical protein